MLSKANELLEQGQSKEGEQNADTEEDRAMGSLHERK